MFSSEPVKEKPSYSCVVTTSKAAFRQNQYEISSSSTDTTDSDNDNSSNEKLDISDFSHLARERFKIDRRKLEKMIKTSSQADCGTNSAEEFFSKIMKTTDTFITWPRNLRIGAKTRKDPFVNIIGRPNDITWAKGLILASLATRGPLLKMKMIIADTDHPHIIGRVGSNVKSIMEQTDTHIHFPDSNRRTLAEKSNVVALYGTLESLERARVSLRASTPLLMSFELPIGTPLPRHDIPYIKQLEIDFNVKIIFMSIPRHDTYFAVVKGAESGYENLKEAVRLLVNSTCGTRACYTLLNINLEISKQIFDLAVADNRINLSDLKAKTQTIFSVPEFDENVNNIPVLITGSVEGVYEAKKELMSHLPIELTFDIPENPNNTYEVMSLGMKYGITITMQHKQKDNSVTVTMKAPERIISHIYEANQEVFEMQNTSGDETELLKAYFLVEPAYRKSLENNTALGQYDDIATRIWAPIERSSFEVSSGRRLNSTTYNEVDGSPSDLLGQQETDSFSSDLIYGSEDGHQEGSGSSSDWNVIRTAQNDSPQFDYDFDSDDLEVAFIFMSSPVNFSPIKKSAPRAELINKE